MFQRGVYSKKYYLENQGAFTHRLYDNTVFARVRELFGGRLSKMLTASAPISADVLTFFKIALGIHVYEAYG